MSRYSVYRNLNNGKLSVRDNKGLVVGHCDAITLFGVKFNDCEILSLAASVIVIDMFSPIVLDC